MEYGLSVMVSLFLFAVLDIIVSINAFRHFDRSRSQRVFLQFAVAVTLQQLFSACTELSKPGFNLIGDAFVYVAYGGSLIFMTLSAYYWYIYLKLTAGDERENAFVWRFLRFVPVIVITVTALLAPVTRWLFYVDENGLYQRGKLFILQMVCPYIYLVMTMVFGHGFRKNNKTDRERLQRSLRFFFSFMIPSLVCVVIQMFVVQGGYSSIGISMGLMMMYLEIYIDDVNENKRLKSVETLNARLRETNVMLEERMNVIQSMSRVYFASFYVNLGDNTYKTIRNVEHVSRLPDADGVASRAFSIFCDSIVKPEYAEKMRDFVDGSTINDRMRGKEFITCDYEDRLMGWCQLYFIAGERDENGTLKTAFLASRTIHDEKERELAKNRELDDARIAAEQANAAKTVFLNNMSHDIRTPLNAILGFTSLISKEKENPDLVEDYLKKIKTSGEYLLTLINNVLDMARIESGNVVVENTPMDLLTEESKIRTYCGALAETAGRRFTMGNTIRHRYVLIDAAKHQQIMNNLIGNAMKYTPENGSVHLQVDELPCDREGFGTYRMTVSDTGIGMTPEYLERIFDSFSRERNTTDSKVVGTGLGMTIVKKLADLLGATIVVESEKGKGSRFTVTCDLEWTDDPQPENAPERDDASGTEVLKGKRILLAEDNELNAEIAIALLEDEGFAVEHAENGAICIGMLNNAPEGYYDVVLMDIQMPVLNGYDATRRIREAGNSIPIIAMTANAFEEDRRNAMDAGMNGHLSKPMVMENVLEMLKSVLK